MTIAVDLGRKVTKTKTNKWVLVCGCSMAVTSTEPGGFMVLSRSTQRLVYFLYTVYDLNLLMKYINHLDFQYIIFILAFLLLNISLIKYF